MHCARDRGHYVVITGPYAIISHHGCLLGSLWVASIPLILRSLYAFVPFTLYMVLMFLRTYLEDRIL